MAIAILAWGSLIWNPGSLHIDGGWRLGGPTLPIEFSRISDNGRLTLVIDEQCGVPVPTRFALSSLPNVDDAVRDLQRREAAPTARGIGFIDRAGKRSSESALKKIIPQRRSKSGNGRNRPVSTPSYGRRLDRVSKKKQEHPSALTRRFAISARSLSRPERSPSNTFAMRRPKS